MRFVTPLTLLLPVATAFAQQQQNGPGGSFMTSVLPMMLAMVVIVYFLMIRPEQKKQKQRQSMLGNLKKGDKVITTGGVHGVVGNVKDSSVMVKVADNTVMEFTKASISNVITKENKKEIENKG
jgi:preprotein translocase subunit YajC